MPDDPENAVLFGIATVLGDRRALVTDSWYDGPADQSGAVYVFEQEAGTSTTTATPTATPPVRTPGGTLLGTAAALGLLALRAIRRGDGAG